jgi:hypothetical protein
MSGFEQHPGLLMSEDPVRDAVWRCDAFFVSGGGGEASVVISGVYGHVDMPSAASLIRRWEGYELVLMYGSRGLGRVVVHQDGGE